MRTSRWLHAWVLATAATACGAQTVASSNFSTSADGWRVQNGADAFTWRAKGGDPGGYIQAQDVGGQGLWFFSAPAAYLGNVSAAYGGAFSYDVRSVATSAPIGGAYAAVQLLGANGMLLAAAGATIPGSGWSRFSFDLVANGAWRIGSTGGTAATVADLQGVLSNLASLRIDGDFYQGIETTALDSVRLAAGPALLDDSAALGLMRPAALVPEASGAALLAGGLAMLAGVMRSKRRSVRL